MSDDMVWDYKKISLAVTLGIVFIGVTAAPSYYFYSKYQETQKALTSVKGASTSQEEAKLLTEKISKLMWIPQDETPTVATVSDIEKLKGQPFFANAKNGDKVLVFAKAKKAILYDPVAEKIIEVGPVIFPSTSPSPSGTASQPLATDSAAVQKLSVVLYNGTLTDNLTAGVKTQIEKDSRFSVINRLNALKTDYTKTLVLPLHAEKKQLAEALARSLQAQIVASASGENLPTSGDVLVILGQDIASKTSSPSGLKQ